MWWLSPMRPRRQRGRPNGSEVPGDDTDQSPADANPAAGEPTTGPHGKSLAETHGRDNQDNNDSNQDHGCQSLQAQGCHRNNCGTPQDRRHQLDRRLCGALPAGDIAPDCRISLLGPSLSEARGVVNAAIAEVFSLLLNHFLRDWCRISYRCDGTILFSSTASRSATDVEPYTPTARAIR